MSLGVILFCQKCMGALDLFVRDYEDPSLEIAVPAPSNARDPFLWIQKKMGHTRAKTFNNSENSRELQDKMKNYSSKKCKKGELQ